MMPKIKFIDLFLAFLIGLAIFVAYNISTFYSLKSVLHRAGLNSKQNAYVVYKQEEQGMGHNHEYYYCIQLESFEVAKEYLSKWHAGPEKNKTYSEVIISSGEIGESSKCFTGGGKPDTANVKAFIRMGDSLEEVDLYLFEPASKRLLYVSFGT